MLGHPEWTEEQAKDFCAERLEFHFVYEPYTQLKAPVMTGWFISVSEHGFRLIKDQRPWPPVSAAFNVFVFGGSTAFGSGVTDEQMWQSSSTASTTSVV